MEYDEDKIDEMTLALLWLGLHDECRVWKEFDQDAMGRLHAKGFISDSQSKARSVVLTEEGVRLTRELFERHFTRKL